MGNEKNIKGLHIYNEQGILKKTGGGFHTPTEFSVQNLFHVIWSFRYLCDGNYMVARDYLEYYSLIYVISGKMEFFYEDKHMIVHPGEAVMMDFRKPHRYCALTNRLEKWEMIFRGNASEALYNLLTEKWGYHFGIHGRTLVMLERLMEEMAKPLPDDMRISVLIHELFLNIMESSSNELSEPVRQALSYIYTHYDHQLQIQEIADSVNLSRAYFTRQFKKETGKTPYEYLLDVRINKAKELLAGELFSVAETAEMCGFVNTSHFIRCFRAQTGSTPAGFRNFFNLKKI